MTRLIALGIRHPRRMLAAWLALTVTLGIIGVGLEDKISPTQIAIPGSPSAVADGAAAPVFGTQADLTVLLEGPRGPLLAQSRGLEHLLRAQPGTTVRRGHAAPGTALLRIRTPTKELFTAEAADRTAAAVRQAVHPPVRVSTTGFSVISKAMRDESLSGSKKAEKIAVPILLLVLLLVFRTPIAAGIPALLGIATVISARGVAVLVEPLHAISDIVGPMSSMLGLALGVDYSLLMVSRFRQGLDDGLDVPDAVALAGASAGRTVLFAGCTLVVTMFTAHVLSPADFFSIALGVSCAAIVAMLGALTAVPALLTLAGHAINRHRIGPPARQGPSRLARLALLVQRRPLATSLPIAAVLLALTPGALNLDIGPPDVRLFGPGSPTRVQTEHIASSLGRDASAPFSLYVLERRHPPSAQRLQRLRDAVAREQNVAAIDNVEIRGNDIRMDVVPATRANDAATARLYDRLRARSPFFGRLAHGRVLVGGSGARVFDLRRGIADGLPLMLAGLALMSAVIFVVILRAIVLPLISVALNLLTVGGSLGVLSLVSTGEHPLFGGPGFAEGLSLLVTFTVVFALSLDYQVFILARVRECWLETGRVDLAITRSIDSTGRVVTGAAAIMAGVFAAFALQELQTIRQVGVGLVTAILIDATLVRLVLLPAATTLCGRWTFWLPGWLDRRLPHLDVEGSGAVVEPT